MLVPEISGVSIVLLGSFNPAIFHPAWFSCNGLIRSQEGENAKLDITHPEISSFSVDWFKLSVSLSRFAVETADSHHFEPLRDLVMGTFGLLEHTPASKMGLNRFMHFPMPNQDKWHAFGHLVAPKKPWEGIMQKPGLRSLLMEDIRKEPPGFLRVRIEPSAKVSTGVFIEVNNHYELESQTSLLGLMDVLKRSWADVIKFSDDLAQHLLEQEY